MIDKSIKFVNLENNIFEAYNGRIKPGEAYTGTLCSNNETERSSLIGYYKNDIHSAEVKSYKNLFTFSSIFTYSYKIGYDSV